MQIKEKTMSKNRTIQELHSKDIGHRKFAKVCDLLISKDHKVENIVEYYEKFRFDVDGFWFEYSKDWKASSQDYVDYLLNILHMKKIMAKVPKQTFKLKLRRK